MAAFIVVNIDITDPVGYEEYKRIAAPTVTAHGGRYIVRGGDVEALEGSWRPGRLVVLEFPTLERAKEWWLSESYGPAKELRQRTANTQMILVQGV